MKFKVIDIDNCEGSKVLTLQAQLDTKIGTIVDTYFMECINLSEQVELGYELQLDSTDFISVRKINNISWIVPRID